MRRVINVQKTQRPCFHVPHERPKSSWCRRSFKSHWSASGCRRGRRRHILSARSCRRHGLKAWPQQTPGQHKRRRRKNRQRRVAGPKQPCKHGRPARPQKTNARRKTRKLQRPPVLAGNHLLNKEEQGTRVRTRKTLTQESRYQGSTTKKEERTG